MAEEQGKIGEEWNRRLNAFLSKVLGWRQMGDSGNDIFCEELNKTVGMDSVFSYKNNRNSPQQIVFVEAKTRQDMKAITKSSIEKMIDVMLEQLEFAPFSIDFRRKYFPDGNAEYSKGLIGFWIRGEYSSEKFSKILSEIQPPRKSISQNILVVSNDRLSFLYEMHLAKSQFERQVHVKDLRYFFPHYSEKPACDGECLPIESLLSEFIVIKARETLTFPGITTDVDIYLIFYSGEISEYHDLHFIGLFIKDFQIHDAKKIYIYTRYDSHNIRNSISNFREDFKNLNTEFEFKQLRISSELPDFEEEL